MMMTTQPHDLDSLVLIRGGGDLASGIAVRLHRCGFRLAMTEIAQPLTVRRTVSFSEAVYNNVTRVEGIEAVKVKNSRQALRVIAENKIPILVDPLGACRKELHPDVILDAIMAKYNTGTTISDAPLVIALGPGFTAGVDCHAVVETNRGHHLGRVIEQGSAEPDTGQPGEICGKRNERVLRAPVSGIVEARVAIGDLVTGGQIVASVQGSEVRAQISGVLRGMVHDRVCVKAGTKIGDIDPRGEISYCYQVSDKSLAIAGGVLEAIFANQVRSVMQTSAYLFMN